MHWTARTKIARRGGGTNARRFQTHASAASLRFSFQKILLTTSTSQFRRKREDNKMFEIWHSNDAVAHCSCSLLGREQSF